MASYRMKRSSDNHLGNRQAVRAVDNFENTRFSVFNKAQKSSPSEPDLAKTEDAENRAFFDKQETDLGTGVLPVAVSLDSAG
jgi:hypothetical protein